VAVDRSGKMPRDTAKGSMTRGSLVRETIRNTVDITNNVFEARFLSDVGGNPVDRGRGRSNFGVV
jgi:hypothetical protein